LAEWAGVHCLPALEACTLRRLPVPVGASISEHLLEPLVEQTKAVLIEALKLGPEAARWRADAPLLGAVPELDSLAVINVITAIEDRFGIHIDDDEVSGDLFATLGTLTAFIEEKMND
jgi:acyl carrier protein